MRTLIVFVAVLILPALSYSATINVPGDYPTIQEAIDASVNGDTVLVASGTYVEKIDFKGKGIMVQGSDGPDFTVIDGNKSGSVVTFKNGETTTSVLEGFTITNGTGTNVPWSWINAGGGILCEGTSPVIRENIITINTADVGAGIVCSQNSSPTITCNRITENTAKGSYASGGGGIGCLYLANPIITHNIISNNKSQGVGSSTGGSAGGGIGCYFSAYPTISDNIMIGNTAEFGGAVFLYDSCSATIDSNIISSNRATGGGPNEGSYGGGIHIDTNSSAKIVNNAIYANCADYGGCGIGLSNNSSANMLNNTICGNIGGDGMGGGIALWTSCNARVTNTILWNNDSPKGPEIGLELGSTLNISHSDVEGGKSMVYVDNPLSTLNWGSGMIAADPLFVDAAGGDLHIEYPSPCRDTGDNSAVPPIETDFEGDPRICHGTVDMGADECFRHLYYTGDATPGGSVELKFVELPGTSPVGFWIAFNALETPIPGAYGDWWLLPPMIGPFSLGSIPSNGVYVLPGTIPASLPGPYTLYLQAIMGTPLRLTNLCTMDVQ